MAGSILNCKLKRTNALLSISFDASGNPVVHTPSLNPAAMGFDILIVASDTPVAVAQERDPPGEVAYPLDPSGETTIPATSTPSRFFRLRVTER